MKDSPSPKPRSNFFLGNIVVFNWSANQPVSQLVSQSAGQSVNQPADFLPLWRTSFSSNGREG